MKKKLLVKIEETEEKYNITYFCAENEEDYYNGNHDVMARWSIDKDLLSDPEDENELIERIKMYDTSFASDQVIIVF